LVAHRFHIERNVSLLVDIRTASDLLESACSFPSIYLFTSAKKQATAQTLANRYCYSEHLSTADTQSTRIIHAWKGNSAILSI